MLHFSCFIYIVIKVITFKIVNSRVCDVPCPQYKSYCSDVGCVSSCSAPFYVNGTNCVMSCGNRFVDQNRNCIENCPVGTYIKETLQFADAKQYLEKTCVQCGVEVGFILNNECVISCPEKWKYVLEENRARCLQECPIEKPYTNYVDISRVLHGECVATCSAFVNDGVCTASCSDDRRGFGNICVDVCPVSSPYIYNGNCYKECPQMTFLNETNNFSCVTVCPNERPYILHNICVENCPQQFSYIKESKGFKYCVENCQENEKLIPDNSTCVDVCPLLKVTFNSTCIDHCPQESTLSCKTRKGQLCGNDPRFEEAHTVCVHLCPSNMFRWENTCVYACPDNVPRFESECTENCSIDRPYKINHYITNSFYEDSCYSFQQIFECTRECPSDYFMYNEYCLSHCPYPLLQYESFCVSKCPDSAPLQINSTVQLMVCKETSFKKETRIENVVKCVSSCGPSHVQFESTCTEECPESSQFVHNSTCQEDRCTSKYVELTKFGIVCNDSCSGYILEYNNTCYRKCPQPFMVLNGTCVEKCPDSHIYIAASTYSDCSGTCSPDNLRHECVEQCPNETFINKGNCVQFCEPPLKAFKNQCVSACPDSAPFINVSVIQLFELEYFNNILYKSFVSKQVIYCVSDCPSNKAYNNGTCTESCPPHSRYITNRTCSSKTCNTKFTYVVNPLGIICADQCPYNMFEYNQTCVQHCPNNYKLYNSTCLPSCPKSDQFISEEPLATDLYNCSDTVCSKVLRQICKKECTADQYLEDETCLSQCTDGRYIFEHTCYEKCPNTHPLIQPVYMYNYYKQWQLDWKNIYSYRDSYSSNRLNCVNKCSEGYYQYGNSSTCVKRCDEPFLLSFNGVCVKECPANTLLDTSDGKCVEKCPEDTAKYNNSCHKNCPDNLKIFNFQCVSECPSSAPFEMKNDRHVCRKSCGIGKLFKDGDCIDSFKCTDPLFDFAGACIESCPEGFVWFVTCNSLLAVYLAIGILPIISLSVLVCCFRQFVCDIVNVLKLGFASKAQLYYIQWEMYNKRIIYYRDYVHMMQKTYEDNLQNPESSEETETLLEQNDNESYAEIETLC